MHIAAIYRGKGIKKKYIQSLRGVLRKYPASVQSKQAHLELEEAGVKIGTGSVKLGGGLDAE